ncbi:unnamed protein product [Ectocarpus sp. 6 AP-2014]
MHGPRGVAQRHQTCGVLLVLGRRRQVCLVETSKASQRQTQQQQRARPRGSSCSRPLQRIKSTTSVAPTPLPPPGSTGTARIRPRRLRTIPQRKEDALLLLLHREQMGECHWPRGQERDQTMAPASLVGARKPRQ